MWPHYHNDAKDFHIGRFSYFEIQKDAELICVFFFLFRNRSVISRSNMI